MMLFNNRNIKLFLTKYSIEISLDLFLIEILRRQIKKLKTYGSML
jgi:hypothetical protein